MPMSQGWLTGEMPTRINFLQSEGQKLTLTPIFIDAVARALYEFPNDKYFC